MEQIRSLDVATTRHFVEVYIFILNIGVLFQWESKKTRFAMPEKCIITPKLFEPTFSTRFLQKIGNTHSVCFTGNDHLVVFLQVVSFTFLSEAKITVEINSGDAMMSSVTAH